MLEDNNIQITEETVLTFTDSSQNDCIDTGRSTGGYIISRQAGAVDYGSHLPVPHSNLFVPKKYLINNLSFF